MSTSLSAKRALDGDVSGEVLRAWRAKAAFGRHWRRWRPQWNLCRAIPTDKVMKKQLREAGAGAQ
jgi:hypothetical protein